MGSGEKVTKAPAISLLFSLNIRLNLVLFRIQIVKGKTHELANSHSTSLQFHSHFSSICQ